jgi:hypothetical protein
MSDIIWYTILLLGAWRAVTLVRDARRGAHPLAQARQAAIAFGIAGVVLWSFYVLDEARANNVFTAPSIMGILGALGAAVIFAVLILLPMWTPWLMLRSSEPSDLRRGISIFVSRAVAAFAVLCILVAPFMFGFANSAGDFLRHVLTVAIPLVVLVLIASTLARLVRRLG